jgi:SPP1 gp7 family putative phage head morphogenesis protein
MDAHRTYFTTSASAMKGYFANEDCLAAKWLRQHGATERSFARVLRTFLGEQADHIARMCETYSGLTPEAVGAVFQADAEHQLLMPIVRRNVGGMLIRGATDELERVYAIRDRKDVDDLPFADWLPTNVRNRIHASLDEIASQPYWRRIQDETEADLIEIIKRAIDQGLSPHGMSVLIRDQLGGYAARRRAMRIARTTTTGALNAGHVASMEELSAEGLIMGKEWSAIGDDRTREAHEDANGQVVPVNGLFIVAGYECEYPGDGSLPGDQTINCRCTVLSVLDPSLME